jgi:hypothetical protein
MAAAGGRDGRGGGGGCGGDAVDALAGEDWRPAAAAGGPGGRGAGGNGLLRKSSSLVSGGVRRAQAAHGRPRVPWRAPGASGRGRHRETLCLRLPPWLGGAGCFRAPPGVAAGVRLASLPAARAA